MKKIVLKTVGTLSMLILAFGLMSNGDGDGGNVVKSKFIGTNTGWGACGPNSSGDGGCSQGEYEQTFIVLFMLVEKLQLEVLDRVIVVILERLHNKIQCSLTRCIKFSVTGCFYNS